MNKNQQPVWSKKQLIGILLCALLVVFIRLIIFFLPNKENLNLENQGSLGLFLSNNDTINILLADFDPNTADSLTLIRLGLKRYQVKSILNYRKKNGKYREPSDFLNVPGMNDSVFNKLLPFIKIDTMPFYLAKKEKQFRDSLKRDSLKQVYQYRRDSIAHHNQMLYDSIMTTKNYHIKRDTIFEMNSVDTVDMQYIKGIGPVIAKRIYLYRERLGGFYSIRQLEECDVIHPISWDSIYPHFYIDTTLIRKIKINTASIDKLMRHPYIGTFNRAKNIYDTRRKKIAITKKEDLCPDVLSEEEFDRLAPYLDFSKPR